MIELNTIYNMDCMEGMKQIPDKYFELAIVLKGIKPFCCALNIGEITRTSFKWGIIRHEHTADLRKMDSGLTCYLGLVGNCFAKFNDSRIILNTLFVIVRASQSIHTKIKRFGHIAVEQITNFAGVKAYESKYINFTIVVSLSSVFATTLNVKNVCLASFRSLRNNTRRGSGLYLNAQKVLAVIHKYIVRKPLLARKRDKAFHNKVSANKIFASLADLEFVAKSHKITSNIFYHTYYGVSSATSKAVA